MPYILHLKVLPSKMDLAEIRLIRQVAPLHLIKIYQVRPLLA
jgi:hypothetical protein